jgi:peptidoglycan/xylan/chitin deacetylase (PgdA/CDA1 family)
MTAPDAAGDAERDRFLALLDQAAEQSKTLTFWWRDDDAVTPTSALERLLALARRYDLPLALAVIPKDADEALAARVAEEPRVSVLQHGWQHRNHAAPDEKKMELGAHRPLSVAIDELSQGFERLGRLFPEAFLPVLVPPWNRIADNVRNARLEVGLAGLSTFGPAPTGEAHQVNTHLDIIDWRARAHLPRAEAYAQLCHEVVRRLSDDAEPLGILTHHLVHEEASWDFLDELLGLTANHPAVAWPTIRDLFHLPG